VDVNIGKPSKESARTTQSLSRHSSQGVVKSFEIEITALVWSVLVIGFKPGTVKIEKLQANIHQTSKVIRACIFKLLSVLEVTAPSTTNVYHKQTFFSQIPHGCFQIPPPLETATKNRLRIRNEFFQ
jgi:hypothetical protein